VATYLAARLVTDGYLIHWRSLDALQTPAGLYTGWGEGQSTIMGITAVATAYASSRGIISVLDGDLAVPARAVRPTVDGETSSPEAVPIPSVTVSTRHGTNGELNEIGSRRRERWAMLSVVGYGRDLSESMYLVDRLRDWFDELTDVPLQNHDNGSLTLIQRMEVHDCAVTSAVIPLKHEAQVYEIALSASLRYEA